MFADLQVNIVFKFGGACSDLIRRVDNELQCYVEKSYCLNGGRTIAILHSSEHAIATKEGYWCVMIYIASS